MWLETLRIKLSEAQKAEAKAARRLRRSGRRSWRLDGGKLGLDSPTGLRSTRAGQAGDRFVEECRRADFLGIAKERIERAIWKAKRELNQEYGEGEALPGHRCPWCGASNVFAVSLANLYETCPSILDMDELPNVAKCNCESNNFHDRGHPGDCRCNK